MKIVQSVGDALMTTSYMSEGREIHIENKNLRDVYKRFTKTQKKRLKKSKYIDKFEDALALIVKDTNDNIIDIVIAPRNGTESEEHNKWLHELWLEKQRLRGRIPMNPLMEDNPDAGWENNF